MLPKAPYAVNACIINWEEQCYHERMIAFSMISIVVFWPFYLQKGFWLPDTRRGAFILGNLPDDAASCSSWA